MPYAEGFRLICGRFTFDFYVPHDGKGRSITAPLYQPLDLVLLAFGYYFDPTVGEVPHPACEAKFKRLSPRVEAVEYPLDSTGDVQMGSDDWHIIASYTSMGLM